MWGDGTCSWPTPVPRMFPGIAPERRASDDHPRPHRHARQRQLDAGQQRVADDEHARPAVDQHMQIVRRRQQRIDRHRHRTDLHRAEETGREVGRIVHQQQRALLDLQPEPAQHLPDPVRAREQLRIRDRPEVVDIRDPLPPPACTCRSSRSTAAL